MQEFCRIYGEFFPFGDPEQLASLVFRGFGVGSGEDGVVGFPQFITALSTATRGSLEERIASESQSTHDCTLIVQHLTQAQHFKSLSLHCQLSL